MKMLKEEKDEVLSSYLCPSLVWPRGVHKPEVRGR